MKNSFRIRQISVKNFRCFKDLKSPLTFEPDLTVLVARNGEGKTAFLDAVKIAFGTFTNSFPVTVSAGFHPSDAHIDSGDLFAMGSNYPISLEAQGIINGVEREWRRDLLKTKGRTTVHDAAPVTEYGNDLYSRIQKNEEGVDLPLIAFYGTGRLWAEHKDMDSGKISPLAQSRFAGYENALSARSTYKQVKNWLLEALRLKDSKTASESQTGKFVLPQLEAIEKALSRVLSPEGFEKLHYNPFYKTDISVMRKETKDGEAPIALPISWLSDGVRAVFSMVADIAYRCVKLNPHLGIDACEETEGIVLIDEVDIFLHPAWQQHILTNLREAFPCIQFIVTTHSPQVVSAVPQRCVRIIHDGEIEDASVQTELAF